MEARSSSLDIASLYLIGPIIPSIHYVPRPRRSCPSDPLTPVVLPLNILVDAIIDLIDSSTRSTIYPSRLTLATGWSHNGTNAVKVASIYPLQPLWLAVGMPQAMGGWIGLIFMPWISHCGGHRVSVSSAPVISTTLFREFSRQ